MPTVGPHDIRDRAVLPRHEGLSVENAFAGTLAAGTLVYVSGVNTTTGLPKVTKADADATGAAKVATYITIEAIAQSGSGRVARATRLRGVDTSSWTLAGDAAYLDTTAGVITPTAPTATNSVVQTVGYCIVKSSTIGELYIDLRAAGLTGASIASLLASNNTWTGNNAFGVDGTGVDVTLYGDTAGRQVKWDESADTLRAADSTNIGWGSGAGTTPDFYGVWDGTRMSFLQLTPNSAVRWGVDGAGIDQVLFGDTAGVSATWDQSADSYIFTDNALLVFGTGSDVTVRWDGTDLDILAGADDLVIKLGNGTNSFDLWLYGNTASDYVEWDASVSTLYLRGLGALNVAGSSILGPVSSPMTAATSVAGSGTIALPTTGINKAVSSASAVTGVILAAGTVAGQILMLHNVNASNAITFDATPATARVAVGSFALAAGYACLFTWDATAALWYPVKAS